jgi:hypothetical protein
MKRPIAIICLALLLSCSKQETASPHVPGEEHALAIASQKCTNSTEMTWLRDLIRQAETETSSKGVIYAIEYTGGVAFIYQPWISSCYACIVFDCEGKGLTVTESLMHEITEGTKDENIIYTTAH